MRLLPYYWDGSWFWPWREEDGVPVFRARRFMLDWADPYAPRRLYYHGKHLGVTLALEADGKTQVWSWWHRWFTRKTAWLTVHPANYRRFARTPPWMQRPEHEEKPWGAELQHMVSTSQAGCPGCCQARLGWQEG